MSPMVGDMLYSLHRDKTFYPPETTDNCIADIWEPGLTLKILLVNGKTGLGVKAIVGKRHWSLNLEIDLEKYDKVLWSMIMFKNFTT